MSGTHFEYEPFSRLRVTFGEPIEDAMSRDLPVELLAFWETNTHLDRPDGDAP